MSCTEVTYFPGREAVGLPTGYETNVLLKCRCCGKVEQKTFNTKWSLEQLEQAYSGKDIKDPELEDLRRMAKL